MILKFLENIETGDVLARDILVNDSVYYSKGREIAEDVINRVRDLGITYVYVEGEPAEDDLIRQYMVEIKGEVPDEDMSSDEKFSYLIEKKVEKKKLFELYPFVSEREVKEGFISYVAEEKDDNTINFFLRTLRTSTDSQLKSHILNILGKWVDGSNVMSFVSLVSDDDRNIAYIAGDILKERFSLRQLYELKKKLEDKGEVYDFFRNRINFSLMSPMHFWDKKVVIVTNTPEKHMLLKTYLENLEMIVEVTDYEQRESVFGEFSPYIFIFDFDGQDNALDLFRVSASEYSDRIFFILSSYVDKKLFWETTNSGASYFIRKPYSLPRIQRYLTSALQNGKLLSVLNTSNRLLKIEIKYFGDNIKKMDFFGELIGMTVQEIEGGMEPFISASKYYFFDMANVIRLDTQGIRFILKKKDDILNMDAQLFIMNYTKDIEKELMLYANQLDFVNSWEEAVWHYD